MVAALVPPQSGDVHLATEIRGAPARLWDEGVGEVVISGPAGTGKTRAILEWIHRRCATERLRVLILRKTEEALKASALVTFQEEVLYGFDGRRSAYDGVSFFGGNKIKPAQFTYDDTGSVIVGGGMDNPNKVKSSRWDIVFINEVTELNLNEWEMISGRTDRPGMEDAPPSLIVGDCNPDAPTHWVYQRATEGTLQLWPSRHEDNPAMYDRIAQAWTAAGRRYLARLNKLTGVRRDRLRDGLWVAAEGQVYEGWSPAVHLIDRFAIPNEWPRFWWIDFGFVHPFVWLWVAQAPDGDLIVYREIYMTGRIVADHAKQGLALSVGEPRPKAVITDHDAEDRATFEREAKVKTIAANKEVSPGIQAVQKRLRAEDGRPPRLRFFRDLLVERDPALVDQNEPCSTIEEFPVYVWDTRQGQRKGESPVKAKDHGMDSSRYGIMYFDEPKPKRGAWGFS